MALPEEIHVDVSVLANPSGHSTETVSYFSLASRNEVNDPCINKYRITEGNQARSDGHVGTLFKVETWTPTGWVHVLTYKPERDDDTVDTARDAATEVHKFLYHHPV